MTDQSLTERLHYWAGVFVGGAVVAVIAFIPGTNAGLFAVGLCLSAAFAWGLSLVIRTRQRRRNRA